MTTYYKCDFCSIETNVLRAYNPLESVKQLTVGDVTALFNDTGPWCACKDCEKLIDADNWKSLLERALEPLYVLFPAAPRSVHVEAIKAMWVVVFGEDRVKL